MRYPKSQKSGIFLILVFWLACDVLAQSSDSGSNFALGIGSNFWLQHSQYAFSPLAYEGEVAQYTALPTDQFTTEKKSNLLNSTNGYITLSWIKEISEHESLNIEFGVSQTFITGTNSSSLRYTDQIDVTAGFVKASSYTLDQFQSINRYFIIRPKWQFSTNLFGLDQKIGLGFMGYLMFNSRYSLQMTKDNEDYYYAAHDVKLGDWIWQATPELSYQVKIAEFGKTQAHFNIGLGWRTLHFTQVAHKKFDKYAKPRFQDARPILNIGFILDGNGLLTN